MYLLPREVVASSVKYSMNILLYLDHLFQDDNFSLSSKTLLIKKSKITLLFEVKNFYFAAIYFKNFWLGNLEINFFYDLICSMRDHSDANDNAQF